MIITKAKYEILTPINGESVLKELELYARVCYKSEDRITETSYKPFLEKVVMTNHHESIIEHKYVTVLFNIDRGISHEIVRHRLANFTQSSTRYCNYSKNKFGNEINVIDLEEHFKNKEESKPIWLKAMHIAEESYMALIKAGETPQIARSVLPTSLMTELIVTANLREWRHIFKLRTSSEAHPQIKEIMIPLLKDFKQMVPLLFEDL